MSAFVAICEHSNNHVDEGLFRHAMEQLAHRGPDGHDEHIDHHFALGHWHFWTTPEELNEKQPLKLPGLPFRIVMDGRLDNRSNLISELHVDVSEIPHNSDAALILFAYDRWGYQCFEHLVGEFAIVIYDEKKEELVCARDPMGDRTLFYKRSKNNLIVSSEPWAIVCASKEKFSIDEIGLAYYFSMKAPQNGRTLFKDVQELLPGQAFRETRTERTSWLYWKPNLETRLHYKNDHEYAEHFLFLLEESVRCRMRSITPIGVQMSGGLDSTSVASLAARLLTSGPLITISYIFDELTECDERQYINLIGRSGAIHSIQILCDDAWPFRDLQFWPLNRNHPHGNPFRNLKERVYRTAQEQGIRVLLTGGFADHMYRRDVDWLADLLQNGKLLEAYVEFIINLHRFGIKSFWEQGFLQRTCRRLVDSFPGGAHLHRRSSLPAWLTSLSKKHIQNDRDTRIPQINRNNSMLSMDNAQGCSRESFYANRYEIDLRHPYRDRRLIEFMLAIPAYELLHEGLNKYILRTSMQGILPEVIRTRKKPTAMTSLLFKGVEREESTIKLLLYNSDITWPQYVNRDWLMKLKPDQKGAAAFVPWSCISYEMWYKLIAEV